MNFRLLRGTTALEVKAPPVHFFMLISLWDSMGESYGVHTFWQSVQWQRALIYSSTVKNMSPFISEYRVNVRSMVEKTLDVPSTVY